MKELGLLGVCGEHAPRHVIQDLEREQGATLVANHALGTHQILETVSVSGCKKSYLQQYVQYVAIFLLKQFLFKGISQKIDIFQLKVLGMHGDPLVLAL